MPDSQNIDISAKTIEEAFKLAKEFAGKLINPGLEEGGGIIQDTLKFWRFKNQINILLKAKKFLEEKGIEPTKILPKTLIPLLENGSLEEDEAMQEKWVALLVNAASPEFSEIVKPSFVEILKELSPKEAMALDLIFNMTQSTPIPKEEWPHRGAKGESLKKVLNLNDTAFEIAIDNLYRLKLCQPPSTQLNFIKQKDFRFQLQTKDTICITEFGSAFVKACRL